MEERRQADKEPEEINYTELLEKEYGLERVMWEQMRQEGQTDKEIYESLKSWLF